MWEDSTIGLLFVVYPIEEKMLDVCLYGMIEEYCNFLENFSILLQVDESCSPHQWVNEARLRGRASLSTSSQKRPLVANLEQREGSKSSGPRKPTKKWKPWQFPMLLPFLCNSKKATIFLEEWVLNWSISFAQSTSPSFLRKSGRPHVLPLPPEEGSHPRAVHVVQESH